MKRLLKARFVAKHDTTANWTSKIGFIPKDGEPIVYTDAFVYDNKSVPGVKIGDGKAFVQDLPFVGEAQAVAMKDHINDSVRHITAEERDRWNEKIGIGAVSGETLVFTEI